MDFVDQTGRELQIGDQIVHAYTVGRSASLRRCIVVGFTPKMVRVQPVEFRTQYRRFLNPPARGMQGEWIRKNPPELAKQVTIKSGSNVLVTNDERWDTLEEARDLGLIL